MSLLRQLSEFVRAETFVKNGKWIAARTEFLRCADVMNHANSKTEESVAGLFAASCSYYSGDFEASRNSFSSIAAQRVGPDSDPVTMMAKRYMFMTSLMDSQSTSELQSLLYRGKSYNDMWTHLTVDIEPPIGSYPRLIRECIHAEGIIELPAPSNSTERIAHAHALITVAANTVSKLPKANVDNINISDQVESVSKALKAAEAIAEPGKPDLSVLSKFYIARALLLRGRLFEFNANALMAEGMYRAAAEQSEIVSTPRLAAINSIAKHSLGDLLSKWERREREGQLLKEENPILETADRLTRMFILDPTFDELSRLL